MISHMRPVSEFVLMLTGPMVWASHFFAMYGAEALMCTVVQGEGQFRIVAIMLTMIAIAALLGFIAWTAKGGVTGLALDDSRGFLPFLRDISIVLAMLAAVAVVWTAASGIVLPACAPLPASMQNALAG